MIFYQYQIITVIISIVLYVQFKDNLNNNVDIANFLINYNLFLIYVIIFGILISLNIFFIFNVQKYIIKRNFLALNNSILYLIYISFFFLISKITVNVENFSVTLNIFGITLIFVILSFFYIIKNIYDLLDFFLHKDFYRNKIDNVKEHNKIINCPNCNYMCNLSWKKCPLCFSYLYIKKKKNKTLKI